MRRLGSALMIRGALVGAAAAAWVAVGLDRAGLPWIVSVGLVKLTIVASLGLMAAGAMALRIARRSADAKRFEQIEAGVEGQDAQVRQCDSAVEKRNL